FGCSAIPRRTFRRCRASAWRLWSRFPYRPSRLCAAEDVCGSACLPGRCSCLAGLRKVLQQVAAGEFLTQLVDICELDSRHAEGFRSLDVLRFVIDEQGLSRCEAELFAGVGVDRWIGLHD